MEGISVLQLPTLQHAWSGEPAGHLSAACPNKQQDLDRHRAQAILNPSSLALHCCRGCAQPANNSAGSSALAQAGRGLSSMSLSHMDAVHRLSVIGQQSRLPHIHAVHRLSMVSQ